MSRFWQNMDKATNVGLLDKIMIGKNEDGKTFYADLNQIRGLLAAFLSGQIIPTRANPGANLGAPDEPAIVYASPGIYFTPDGVVTTTANLSMFFWDLAHWNVLEVPVDVDLSGYLGKTELDRYTVGKNQVDPDHVTDGYYMNPDGGLVPSPDYGITGHIEVTPGLPYTGFDGVNQMRKTTYFDASFNVVAGGSNVIVKTIIPPVGVKYVIATYYKSGKATFQFEQSATNTAFEAYKPIYKGIDGKKLSADYLLTDQGYKLATDALLAKLNKSSITYEIGGDQLFDKTSGYLQDNYINASGNLTPILGYKTAVIDLSRKGTATQITISGQTIPAGGVGKYWVYYNGATKLTFGLANTSAMIILAIPSGATHLYLTSSVPQDAPGNMNTLMVNYGNVAKPYADVVRYTTKTEGNYIKYADKDILDKGQVEALIPQVIVENISKNKANPARISTGLVSSGANFGVSHGTVGWKYIIIPLKSITPQTISGWNSSRTEIAMFSGAIPAPGIAPNNGNLIRSGSAASLGIVKSAGKATFTPDAGTTFYAFTIQSSTEDSSVFPALQSEDSATATPYTPFDAKNVVVTVAGSSVSTDYLMVNGKLIEASKVALKEDPAVYVAPKEGEIKLAIYTDNSANSYIEYLMKGRLMRIEVVPYRPQGIDNSTVFDFRSVSIDGVVIHSMGDEAAPFRIAGTTIGSNHGYTTNRIGLAGHGKTNVDVGSVWTNGVKEFVITGIFSANYFDVSSRVGNAPYTGEDLVHVSGATHTGTITGHTSFAAFQLYPAIKNRKLTVKLDGAEIKQQNTKVTGYKSVAFIESYDILDKSSIMEWLITQAGTATPITSFQGTAIATVSFSYTFDKFGGCTMLPSLVNLVAGTPIQDIMFNMNNRLAVSDKYTTLKYMVPKSLPFVHETVAYNFALPTEITATLTNRIAFTPSRCAPTGIYCDRLIMLMDGVGVDGIGYAIGFLPVKDTALANRRNNATRKALEISESKKVYLSTIDSAAINAMAAYQYFSTVAYKNYFIREQNRTALYVVTSNEGTFLFADWHSAGIDRIVLPSELTGRSFTVDEKSANVMLLTQADSNILVEITDSNPAYLRLKF